MSPEQAEELKRLAQQVVDGCRDWPVKPTGTLNLKRLLHTLNSAQAGERTSTVTESVKKPGVNPYEHTDCQ